jgi:hypothetical protein
MLPWISKDQTELHVHVRDVKKVQTVLGDRAGLFVHALDERFAHESAEALLVAAPVAADWIGHWFSQGRGLQFVADLRGDSQEDRLAPYFSDSCAVFDLTQIFGRISDNQTRIEARKTAALKEIELIVRERSSHVEYRPFGWEDVCA